MIRLFPKHHVEHPPHPQVYHYRCSHYDEHATKQQLCPTRASILILTDTDPPIAFGLCSEHQKGDLTNVPIKKVICLPWEDVPPITGNVEEKQETHYICTGCEESFPFSEMKSVSFSDGGTCYFCQHCYKTVEPNAEEYAQTKWGGSIPQEEEKQPCSEEAS